MPDALHSNILVSALISLGEKPESIYGAWRDW